MYVSDKFIYSISIVLTENQILGTTIVKVSKRNLQKSKFGIIRNIFYITIYLLITGFSFYRIYKTNDPFLYKSLDIIILVIYSNYIISVWLHAIINHEKFSDLLKSLINFDQTLDRYGQQVDYKKQRKNDLTEMLIRYATLIIIEIYFIIVRVLICQEDYMIEINRAILLVVKMATCQQIVQIVNMIKTRLKILNFQLGELNDITGNYNRRKVNRYFNVLCRTCDLHHSMIKISKLFNKTFGMMLLLMFGLSFVKTVICFFYISASLQSDEIKWTHASLALLLSLPFIGDMLYICNVCYKTVKETSIMGELIHKINTQDDDVLDEIEMFSLQISNGTIEFSAAEFFVIDHTLIFSIISGVTTYIIILIQLSATLLDDKKI